MFIRCGRKMQQFENVQISRTTNARSDDRLRCRAMVLAWIIVSQNRMSKSVASFVTVRHRNFNQH